MCDFVSYPVTLLTRPVANKYPPVLPTPFPQHSRDRTFLSMHLEPYFDVAHERSNLYSLPTKNLVLTLFSHISGPLY
jgi:hypothetical protein